MLTQLAGLWVLFCLYPGLRTEAQDNPGATNTKRAVESVATILTLKGKAYYVKGSDRVKLSDRPGDQVLYPDMKLYVTEGKMVIVYRDGTKQFMKPRAKPYTVSHLVKDTGRLDSVKATAGQVRAEQEPIYSPPQESNGGLGSVWPSECVFRWLPFPNGTDLTLSLHPRQSIREPIWSKSIKEDGSGTGNYADAREAMLAFRKAEPDADLQFTLATSEENSHTVRFALLSEKDETGLANELAEVERQHRAMEAEDHKTRPRSEWEEATQENALILHISRASVFQHYRLYAEASDEMDKALIVAPNRGDVWRGTIRAHRRTGNWRREQYLQAHAPAGEVMPTTG